MTNHKVVRADIIQGTLDMLILKAVSLIPLHGYAIRDWLRRSSDAALQLEDAALYHALRRLEARALIVSEWGVSENNRRAKYYSLTAGGRGVLRAERERWQRYVRMVDKILKVPARAR